MKVTNPLIKQLLEKYQQINLLNKTNAVLGWDLNVNLPSRGSLGRANQIAYLTELTTNLWLDHNFQSLLQSALKDSKKLTLEERAIVRNLEHAGKYYFKVPKEIVIEFARTTSEAFMVWQEAKKQNNFNNFLPYLNKIIKMNQIIAGHLGYQNNPYNALLDLYEPQLSFKDFHEITTKLQPALTKLLKKIQKSPKYQEKSELVRRDSLNYPIDDQKQLALFVLKRMNYDLESGRLDVSSHPFTTTLDRFDVRITTRYKESDFRESFSSTIHEAGHALYEQGVKEEYQGTPLDGGVSLGIHESQSRFWENQVGRNPVFIKFLTPLFQAFFPEQIGKVGEETLAMLLNQVRPSLIRTEADEVTYNLHIILRFEFENDLINNKLKVQDLPEAWREKMKLYLGVVPETDREGVLQDVHWAYGNFGYFPTYTLGNLNAAQFTATLKKDLNLDDLLSQGDLGTILSWLRENIHQYGSLFWPKDLMKKVTKENLNPNYFLDYLEQKYSALYSLKY